MRVTPRRPIRRCRSRRPRPRPCPARAAATARPSSSRTSPAACQRTASTGANLAPDRPCGQVTCRMVWRTHKGRRDAVPHRGPVPRCRNRLERGGVSFGRTGLWCRHRRHLHRLRADRRGRPRRLRQGALVARRLLQVGLLRLRSSRPASSSASSRGRRSTRSMDRLISHGSTVATNIVVERKGAEIGLITTRGFEDTMRTMRGLGRPPASRRRTCSRFAETRKPEPLVPIERTYGVAERIDSDGDVVVALDEDAVAAAADALVAAGVDTIAIAFLWSVRNDAHERRAREIVARARPRRLRDDLQRDLQGGRRVRALRRHPDQLLRRPGHQHLPARRPGPARRRRLRRRAAHHAVPRRHGPARARRRPADLHDRLRPGRRPDRLRPRRRRPRPPRHHRLRHGRHLASTSGSSRTASRSPPTTPCSASGATACPRSR